MNKIILGIGGMSCSACANRIEKYLNSKDGVRSSVNLIMGNALIYYDDNITIDMLEKYIEESGYKSLGIYKEEEKKDNSKIYLLITTLLLIVLMYISMSHMLNMSINNNIIIVFILTILFIIYGFDIIKSGITKLLHGSANMDSLVSIGVISSFIYSVFNMILVINGNNSYIHNIYFESISMMIYFIKLGRYIDKKSKNETKSAIKELVTITPSVAIKKYNNKELEITIDEVNVGDILICKPGMRIAVDGEVVKGNTHVDSAFITGESSLIKKSIGDTVIAGSINVDGIIEYKAEKIGPDSTISEIVNLVVSSANSKTKIIELVDKISSYFVPFIITLSIITFIVNLLLGNSVNTSLIRFVSVLVVSCPCSLGLATPLAMVVSIGNCAKCGIFIRSNEVLEEAYKIDTIVFDKTGTLTYGKLSISSIINNSNISDKEINKLISSLESNSNHPISKVFKSKKTYEVKDFKDMPGMGIYGIINNKKYYVGNNKLIDKLKINNNYKDEEEKLSKDGNSIIYLIEDNKILCIIGLNDIIRDSSIKAIRELKSLNKKVIMLSGDNSNTAYRIARSLEIEEVIANVFPVEKEKYIRKLMDNNKVMMIGDGINDAPSLVTSNIGVSISSGTDIAANSSDVILMTDDLLKIVDIFNISKKTMKIVKENLFWAFFYNICMIPIAAGLLSPINISISPQMATLSMTISSLIVVINSLRLRK